MTKIKYYNDATKVYTIFALTITVMVWAAISLPFISNEIYKITGFDPLTLFGSGGVLGPKKIFVFNYIIGAGAALLSVAFLATLTQPRKILRFLVLTSLLPVILVGKVWISATPHGAAANRIIIGELPSIDYNNIFNNHAINREKIISFDELYNAVERNFSAHQERLKTAWNIKDKNELQTLFYLNTAANFFSYGDKVPISGSGCAVNNRQFAFQYRNRNDLGVKFYTKSTIGCCTDYASILKFLLDSAGIKNRVVALPVHGHFINEVQLNGKWRALDALSGFYFDRSWEEIVNSTDDFQVVVFPVLSLDVTQPETYRPELGKFRYKILMVAASGAEHASYPQDFTVVP